MQEELPREAHPEDEVGSVVIEVVVVVAEVRSCCYIQVVNSS